MRIRFIVTTLILLNSLACSTSGPAPDAGTPSGNDRPHILLILANDLGYADLGLTGCTDIPTPHLDQLAAEGIVCTDAHVSASVCAPSRAGLLTGRYQQRSGFECNLAGGDGLLAGTVTVAQRLLEAGDSTALVGKWHLGAAEHNHPMVLGFEHFTGLLSGSRSYFPLVEAPPRRPRWLTGEVWRDHQRKKHEMGLLGREAERKVPSRSDEKVLLDRVRTKHALDRNDFLDGR